MTSGKQKILECTVIEHTSRKSTHSIPAMEGVFIAADAENTTGRIDDLFASAILSMDQDPITTNVNAPVIVTSNNTDAHGMPPRATEGASVTNVTSVESAEGVVFTTTTITTTTVTTSSSPDANPSASVNTAETEHGAAKRPRRAAAILAAERVQEVLKWERCKESSAMFMNVADRINAEFDRVSKAEKPGRKRTATDIDITAIPATTAAVEEVMGVEVEVDVVGDNIVHPDSDDEATALKSDVEDDEDMDKENDDDDTGSLASFVVDDDYVSDPQTSPLPVKCDDSDEASSDSSEENSDSEYDSEQDDSDYEGDEIKCMDDSDMDASDDGDDADGDDADGDADDDGADDQVADDDMPTNDEPVVDGLPPMLPVACDDALFIDSAAADEEPGVDGLPMLPVACDDALFIDSAAVDL